MWLDSTYLQIFVRPYKRPPPIDIPTAFASFVEEQGGEICDRLAQTQKLKGEIADYIFRQKNVVAELKCLETDPFHSPADFSRLLDELRKAGMSEVEITDWRTGGRTLTESAVWRLATLFRRRIEKVARKAAKQIDATKQAFDMPSAEGLLLIANDNNYLFNYPEKYGFISDVFARHFEESSIKGFVFFTPNVPMRAAGSLREWHPWAASYSKSASNELVDFVDDLGHHWNRSFFAQEGSRSLTFRTSDRTFMSSWMAGASNVKIRRK
ncbi:hypothetical protein [Bradyrhizobium sp. SZCCHNRI1009]|uniref:hypothetical protein n=1 Tax=Bradyrhizobium sp. SZCCHNRI1009 TaxID=3057277 RepID=UPI002916C2E8|nr:hypothetical protein [Bradyrhizobium sp. SZCCHNRI1009]